MSKAGLIFFEGMAGAGKSTNAARAAEWLEAHGQPARRYHEMDDDNPIRTKGVDAMRANHPHVGRMPGVGEDGFALDSQVYAVERWGAAARRAIAENQTMILESRLMQNSVQPRYLSGAPAAKVREGFAKIQDQIAFSEPLLVYLGPADIRAHLRRTLDERDAAWAKWLIEGFTGYAWARNRGITGEEAVFAFYEDWEEFAAELFEMHRGPKLWIRDPHENWGETERKIYEALSD